VLNGEIINTLDWSHKPALSPPDRTRLADSPFDMLIVTRPVLREQAERLARWRQAEGTRVHLAVLGDTDYPDWESIRDYIVRIDNSNRLDIGVLSPPVMSSVLIFGDADIIPPCQGMLERGTGPAPDIPGSSVSIVGTDLFYSALRGDGEMPDIAIGRLSVDDTIQAEAIVDKIISYESGAPEEIPEHMAVYGYFDDVDDDGQDNWEFVKGSERVRRFMEDRGVSVHFGYTRNAVASSPTHLFDGRPLRHDLSTYGWNVTTAEIVSNWRLRRDGIILHVGHGGRCGWQHPSLHWRDLFDLGAAEMRVYHGFSRERSRFYPIVLNLDCSSGWFDNETDRRFYNNGDRLDDTGTVANESAITNANRCAECFCEMVLRKRIGGAVASFGSARGSEARWNDDMIDGLFGAFYPDYQRGSLIFSEAPLHPPILRLGPAINWAKFHTDSCIADDTYRKYYMQIYHLFGDPMLKMNLPAPYSELHVPPIAKETERRTRYG